jgi:hypothetical protein
MSVAKKISFSFTELLYSVVIGTAILRIGSLTLSRANLLLIIALLFVSDDYLLYHHKIESVEHSGRRMILLFWLDMFVLGAWYALTLAATYSISVYLTCVAVFFACTSIWQLTFSEAPAWRRLLSSGDLPLVCVSLILSVAARSFGHSDLSYVVILLVIFTIWRWRSWLRLWRAPEV